VDFSSGTLTPEALERACRQILASGTAAFLATLVTSPVEVYRRNLPILAQAVERAEFRGRLLGIHLEGPFISAQPGAVGAHNPAWVRAPDAGLLRDLLAWSGGHVRLLTMAAEVPGAEELARCATEAGARVSIGHSLFEQDDLERLIAAGATALTHLGNGLPNALPRHHNPIWLGLAEDRLTAMLIADGHHLPPPLLKTAVRAKGTGRIVAVSDATAFAGLPPGRYAGSGGEVVLEPSGRLYNPERQCLAGSSATLLACVNHLAALGLCSPAELEAVALRNPLALIGVRSDELPAGPAVAYDANARRFRLRIRGQFPGRNRAEA
jgi:N-acetylglucosamine-6-phosphate deacetylase